MNCGRRAKTPDLKFGETVYLVLGYNVHEVRVVVDFGAQVRVLMQDMRTFGEAERTNLFTVKKTAYDMALHHCNAEMNKLNKQLNELLAVGLKLAQDNPK